MTRPLIDHENYYRAHHALHTLWTLAVGTPGYDKRQWKELEAAIGVLATNGKGDVRR